MGSIFTIQQEKLDLENRLEEIMTLTSGELTDEAIEIINQLKFTEENFEDKLESTVNFIKFKNNQLDTIQQEINRLNKLKTYCKNSIERNKTNLVEAMKLFGHEKVDKGVFKVSIRQSTPAPMIYGEIPEEFVTYEQKQIVDNAGVKKYLLENGPQEWGEPVYKDNLQIR